MWSLMQSSASDLLISKDSCAKRENLIVETHFDWKKSLCFAKAQYWIVGGNCWHGS